MQYQKVEEGEQKMEERLFDSTFYAKLNTLKLSTKLKLNAGMSGSRKSTAKGNSVEFSDFREYMLGDDIRRIDWNAYGRMDKLFVKLFMEEKEGLFHIMLDCSKSMDYGERKKSVLARRIAAALSYIILNQLDRVYLTTIKENEIKSTKGMTGRQSFQKILMELEHVTFEGTTDLKTGIMSKPYPSKGVVMIISDFFEENQEQLEEMVKYLTYKKQEVVLIQTLAIEEVHPELEGTLRMIDMETNKEERITMSQKVLKQYEKTLHQFQNHLMHIAKKYQAQYLTMTTEDPLEKLLLEGIRIEVRK